MTVDQSGDLTLATAAYSSGQTIVVRCQAGVLDVIVAGLPAIDGRTRYVETTVGERPTERGPWASGGDGTTVLSVAPAPTARRLRAGGSLRLSAAVSAANDSPLRRYAFDLPGQSASLDRVLEACSTPTTDARDDLPRWMPARGSTFNYWRRMAMPEYPTAADRAGINSGYAVLSCVVQAGGRLDQCVVESESQRRAGFGQSAVRAMGAARVLLAEEGGPPPGELVIFTLRFRVTP
ncbi:MAG: TonB family protein [Pseudomonadota bacterium]|nr:TonB family protein [Pseudomonadota bacterium]